MQKFLKNLNDIKDTQSVLCLLYPTLVQYINEKSFFSAPLPVPLIDVGSVSSDYHVLTDNLCERQSKWTKDAFENTEGTDKPTGFGIPYLD